MRDIACPPARIPHGSPVARAHLTEVTGVKLYVYEAEVSLQISYSPH